MTGTSRAGLHKVRGASFGDVPSPVRRLALGTGLSASRRPRTSALAASTVVCSPQLLRRGQDQADRSGQGAPLKKLGSLLLPPSCLRPGCRPRGRPGVGSEEAGAAAVGACDQRGRRPSGGGRLKARGLGSGSGGCRSWRPGRWQGPTPGYPRAVSRTGLRGVDLLRMADPTTQCGRAASSAASSCPEGAVSGRGSASIALRGGFGGLTFLRWGGPARDCP